MACTFCTGRAPMEAGTFRVLLDVLPGGPRLRVRHGWTDSDGRPHSAEGFMEARYCPLCGGKLPGKRPGRS